MKRLTALSALLIAGCAIGRSALVESMQTHGDAIIPEAIAMYKGTPAPANAQDRLAEMDAWQVDIQKLNEEAESEVEKQFAERMATPPRILFPEIRKLYGGETLNLDEDQVKRRVRLLEEWHETIRTANE